MNFLNGINSLKITKLYKLLDTHEKQRMPTNGTVGQHIQDDDKILCDIKCTEKWVKGQVYFNAPYSQQNKQNIVCDISIKISLNQDISDFK